MDARLVIRSSLRWKRHRSGERGDLALLEREHGSLVLSGCGSIVSRVSRAYWYGGMLIYLAVIYDRQPGRLPSRSQENVAGRRR